MLFTRLMSGIWSKVATCAAPTNKEGMGGTLMKKEWGGYTVQGRRLVLDPQGTALLCLSHAIVPRLHQGFRSQFYNTCWVVLRGLFPPSGLVLNPKWKN